MRKFVVFSFFLLFSVLFGFTEELHLLFKGVYFYEKNDTEWHINFKGKIPTSCGFYFLVFDKNGKILFSGAIPYGDYSEKPYTIKIPKDNITGFYKGVIVAKESVFDVLFLPLSDLEYEVYGGNYFASSYKRKIYFQVPHDDKYILAAYKGHLKVLNESGESIADTKITKKQEKYDNLTEFTGKKGITYILERECRYFRVKEDKKIFISVNPEKFFIPDESIDKVDWWKLPLLIKEAR